jgi:hypothetical protein
MYPLSSLSAKTKTTLPDFPFLAVLTFPPSFFLSSLRNPLLRLLHSLLRLLRPHFLLLLRPRLLFLLRLTNNRNYHLGPYQLGRERVDDVEFFRECSGGFK